MELGEFSREEFRKQQEILRQGNEIREGYVKEANEKKLNINAQLNELKQELTGLEADKNDKHALKETTDQLEREALDRHNAKLDELKKAFEENEAKKAKEDEEKLAMSAFKELDVNEDGSLHYTEIIKFGKFDQNADGIVTEEEAKVFLNNQDSMALDEFLTIGWTLVRPYYLMEKTVSLFFLALGFAYYLVSLAFRTLTNQQHFSFRFGQKATNTNEQSQPEHAEQEHHEETNPDSQNPSIETEEDLETLDHENNQVIFSF